MSEDESFDSFYSKLNEVVIGKFNVGEKTEDSIIVRKILCSLPESFRAKVIAIEESKDLDDIKVQELIGSLQTYEYLRLLMKGQKLMMLQMRMVEKEVAYLAKNFRKFLKFKNSGNFFEKGKFPSFGKDQRTSKGEK